MDELTFLLVLAGIGIVLLVAMFTYYKHHKKIRDEIEDFNYRANSIDDVLLDDINDSDAKESLSLKTSDLIDQELPDSFSASKDEHINIDKVNLMDERSFINASHQKKQPEVSLNKDKDGLVDGVYLHTKRVIANPNPPKNPLKSYSKTTDTFQSHQKNTKIAQTIKMIYDDLPENIEELIISHSIVSKGEHFTGKDLFKAIETAGLLHGEMDIFHYPGDKKAETFALFSLANLVEPGTFNLDEAETLSTPGISLFMRLPSRIDNNDAYDKFIKVAIIIATELDGELCDETRSRLTQQTVTHKKGLIKKLNFDLMKAEKLAQ
ncbi:MAG: cell division protein ZipA [Proteobacteria bacterium]|nr:cell division protein ZipA [Pseudomonadota bacterium]